MPTTIDQVAHSTAVREPVAEVVAYLQDVLGQRLTAVLAGVQDVKAVGKWARSSRVPHPDTDRRLREAYHVVRLLREMESAETVRAWFLGMNPELDDQAPLLALADDPAAVLAAARTFLAHG